jgi:hypothetical protein
MVESNTFAALILAGDDPASTTFNFQHAVEHFIFSGARFCHSASRKPAEIRDLLRVTGNVGSVTCVTLGGGDSGAA